MLRDEQHVKRQKRQRFEAMAIRLANFLDLSQADAYDKLPINLRTHFEDLDYCDLVVRLMKFDKRNGMTFQQISNKYGIPKTTVRNKLK